MVQPLRSVSVPAVVQSDGRRARFEGVAVYLQEPTRSTAVWEIRVWARAQEGRALVAVLRSVPPASSGIAGNRCIAVVGSGGDEWEADARLLTGTAVGSPELWLEPRESCEPGIHYPLERWTCLAGDDGVVSVPAGFRILRVGAVSTAGGTVQIGSNPAATIIAGSTISLEPGGKVLGAVDVTFVGTDAYVIELASG